MDEKVDEIIELDLDKAAILRTPEDIERYFAEKDEVVEVDPVFAGSPEEVIELLHRLFGDPDGE